MCNINDIKNSYEAIYCDVRLNDNESADDELVEILSNQFEMEEELIKEILSSTICETVNFEYTEQQQSELPDSIKQACLESGSSTEQVLGAWNIFTDIRNSYEKEKTIRFNKASLEFKFKASEKYWDGRIGPGDAPFDLIVDLNMIEVVLFGSNAQWMNDIYAFPSDGDDEEGDEITLDDLLPGSGEGEDSELDGEEDTEDSGVSTTEESEEGDLPPGCVPLPDTDLEDSPFYDPSLQCVDPDSIIFSSPNEGGENGNGHGCPAGSVPGGIGDIVGDGSGRPTGVQQDPEYPGPFLGGTLKRFPESNRPACGPGYSAINITGQDEPACIPTDLCGDFNAVREHLFGEDWEDNPEIYDIASSIEGLFCVNIITHNRPQSPYQTIEGCVDCHITAMTDSLEKALSTNVTPLSNTTSAFGISNRFGSGISFNLNTVVKGDPKYYQESVLDDVIEKTQQREKEDLKKLESSKSGIEIPESPIDTLNRKTAEEERLQQDLLKSMRHFKQSNDTMNDQELGNKIKPLINQMSDSFGRIQNVYHSMVTTTGLNETDQCLLF